MTISNQDARTGPYSGNGATTSFSYDFKVIDEDHLVVTLKNSSNVETVQTITTNYTVTGVGANGGGTVEMVVAPASGETLTISRAVPLTQEVDLANRGGVQPEVLETAYDKLTQSVQDQAELFARAPRFPVSSSLTNVELPLTLTAGTTLRVNATSDGFENGPTVSEISNAQTYATNAATSATESANSATESANSATAAAASATTAATYAGTQTVDRFNGTGSQTDFTLSQSPATENNTMVYISGVYQQKDTYSTSGTTLTFSSAPPSGTGNIEVMHMSTLSTGVDPEIGTVTTGAAGSSASVTATGHTLDFTIPRGDTGAQGIQGIQGIQGNVGTAATIAVGSTTTGAAGSSAAVTNSGSSSAATFDFTVPRGDTGATGATGTAATITVGTTTTGNAGTSASVTNSGSSSAATFDFTIPKGDTGATGSTGAAGAAATIAAGSATGLAAGASPTVTNSGSSSAATFNFGIPAGATGATGAAGTAATIAAGTATGLAAGAAPTVTNSGSSSAATFDFGIPAGATGAQGAQGPTGATGSQGPAGSDGADGSDGVFSAIASQAEAEAGSDNVKGMSSLRVKQSVDANARAAIEAASDSNVFTDADHTKLNGIAASANNYVHPNHSGEVTSTADGATVIASSVVDEDNLKVSNSPSDGYILTARSGNTGGMTWEAAAGGGATDIDGLSDAKKIGTSTYGIGSGALADATAATGGNHNTAIGADAGAGTKGTGAGNNPFDNTFIGSSAGYGVNQTGGTAGNVAIGRRAMQLHTGCVYNVIIGKDSGAAISTGSSNTGVGEQSLVAATTASLCTNIGRLSGRHITTGSKNSSLGYEAGILTTTGVNNTSLGYQAMPSSASASNEVTLGDNNVSKLRIPGINFIIKDSTATEDYVLTVDANGEAGWEAAGGGGGGGTWEVIANGSSISAGTYTDISGYKYVKAIFGTAGGSNVGPSLSTSNSSNSGVSVSNGYSYQTTLSGSSTFSNFELSYSPSTSSLYYGNSIIPSSTPHAFRVELFGLDQTNVGIRTGLEGAAGVWDNTTFIGQTSSGSSNWYFYNANAVAYHLIIGVT